MECNKEEAQRARAIAERKMQDKDFHGARKFTLKAQQLYPELENISQIICVCDVHLAAENKMFGNEMDWYGILQIEQTANDVLIKKQYRKLALLLHPDKNKFAGAEAAFKMIGEAQRVLLDVEKRRFYDMKHRATGRSVASNWQPSQASRNVNVGRQARTQNNFAGNGSSYVNGFNASTQPSQQQAQSGVPNGRETFWTLCPYCAVRYQYYKDILGRSLRCQSCKKPFIAYDMHAQGSNASQPVFPRQEVPAGVRRTGKNSPAGSFPSRRQSTEVGGSQQTSQSHMGMHDVNKNGESGRSKPSRKSELKRRKRKNAEDSGESVESGTSMDTEGVEFDSDGDRNARKSARNKRHVSYNEGASGDEKIANLSKTEKEDTKIHDVEGTNNADGNEALANANVKKSSEAADDSDLSSDPENEPEPTVHECPDPDFSDFDKDREENCFKAGQVWAVYDTLDAMPRFYARISKVFSSKFKLRIMWYEAAPDDETSKEWVKAGLPFSCGKFKHGISETTEDLLMFSHPTSWEKGNSKDSIKIYPRKGETWALLKNWDIKWSSNSVDDMKFEYDFVEILSEYDGTVGIRVAYLAKIRGFASLFCRKGSDEMQISPSELLRFSHSVPFYRMTGEEREDVPPGSFELDPACISMNLEEIDLPNKKEENTQSPSCNGSKSTQSKPVAKEAEPTKADCKDEDISPVSPSEVSEIPDPEFFNFDPLRSLEKFQVGQVWALYGDVDGLPNYYGLVKKINSHSDIKLYLSWLEPHSLKSNIVRWTSKDMPVSCGIFKIIGGKPQCYTTLSAFSHQVHADLMSEKNVFAIYPRKGEVWALYKNWSSKMTPSELVNCEYDIVEVLDGDNSSTKVSVLERVNGYNAVFKSRQNSQNGDSSSTIEIPRSELLRFSHQIPYFRLTDEKKGKLRGFWELDPAALPIHMFCTN